MKISRRKRALRAAGGLLAAAGVFRLAQRGELARAVTILNYHGLVDRPLAVPDWCYLPIERFAAQMEYLAARFQVLHLEEALDPSRRAGERPAACITFDDGFASIAELAYPILERLQLPATVFLVTDLVGGDGTMPSARIHQAICHSSARQMEYDGRRFDLDGPVARERASVWLQGALKTVPAERCDAALEDMLAALAARVDVERPFRILRPEDVLRLGRDDLVRFGAHTRTHQILTRAGASRAREEIEGSIRAVRSLVDRPSSVFAYPNGLAADFDDHAIGVVREAGCSHAVTTIEGPNDERTDPYRLRRYGIGARDPFARFVALVHHGPTAFGGLARLVRGG